MFTLTEILIFIGSFFTLVAVLRKRNRQKKPRHQNPPSMPSLPIVGSLPFIRDTEALAERFVVVLNNRESIEDALVRHSSSFSGREGFYSEKYHLNIQQKGLGFMNYNEEFKRYQRLSLSILRELGFGSRSVMNNQIMSDIAELVDHFRKINNKPFNPKEAIIISVSNTPVNILFGRRQRFEDGLNEACFQMRRFGAALDPVLDVFPILRFFPPHTSRFNELKDSNTKLLEALKSEVKESLKEGACDSFVSRYVAKEGINYDYEQLIYTLRDFIGGSTETSVTVLLWTFILFANNPEIMERAQKEIDSAVPRDKLPNWEDEQKLPYVQAIVLEIMRLRSPLPLAIPHLTLHDTEVLGYSIPANAVVLPNIHAAHMNCNDWSEPEIFKPERFLDENYRLINKNLVIPFSLGRRSCPGESLARQQLFLFISGILQNFTVRPPDGISKISVKVIYGITEAPMPFNIRLISRD